MKKILTCLLASLGLTSAYGQAKEQREQSRMNSSFAESRLSSSKAQQQFENTDVQGFFDLIADTNVLLLDVRTAAEFTEGHIKGAILIDQGQSDFVEKAKATLPIDKKIAVYCRSGRRSANAASRLADVGYKCVNLKGGILAWKEAGMLVSSSAQDIQGFVNQQLKTYPMSRLLDIYKSCFQDFMGAEHLVSDRQRVEAFLDEELKTTNLDDLMPWYYEPCGIEGQYVRVSIRAVKENKISKDLLLDAFVRSANSDKKPSVESWRDRWHEIIGTIDQMQLVLPHYQQDREFIDSILSVGKYAISHSPEYRDAYRPHYRIVERGIFEREIKPLLFTKPEENK